MKIVPGRIYQAEKVFPLNVAGKAIFETTDFVFDSERVFGNVVYHSNGKCHLSLETYNYFNDYFALEEFNWFSEWIKT